jgi:hypothetical protein
MQVNGTPVMERPVAGLPVLSPGEVAAALYVTGEPVGYADETYSQAEAERLVRLGLEWVGLAEIREMDRRELRLNRRFLQVVEQERIEGRDTRALERAWTAATRQLWPEVARYDRCRDWGYRFAEYLAESAR